MGGSRMFSLLLLIAVPAGKASPCNTAAPLPVPVPAPAPASPCTTAAPPVVTTVTTTPGTTVTTTPGTTVTTTPATTVTTTPGTTVATTPATTVTTTPLATCVAFTCPDGFKKVGDAVVCTTGQCDQAKCCTYIPTTVTTTPYVPPPTPAPLRHLHQEALAHQWCQ